MRILVPTCAAALALAAVPAALGAQPQTPVGETPQAERSEPAETPAASAASRAPAPPSANEANAQASPGPATVTVTPGTGQSPATVTRNNPGNLTPPPAAAQNKDYPTCTAELQDSCRNPGGR